MEEAYKGNNTASFFPLDSPKAPEEKVLKMGNALGNSVT